MKSIRTLFAISVLFFNISISNAEPSTNELIKIELNQKTGIATVVATSETLLSHSYFTHPNYKGYVIQIRGNNSIFEGIEPAAVLTIEGPYRIDTRGITASLLINDVEVVAGNSGANKTKRTKKNGSQFSSTALDRKSKLRKLVDVTNTEWTDGNITTGTSQVKAGLLSEWVKIDDLVELSRSNFKIAFKACFDEALPNDVKLKSVAGAFSKNDVGFAVESLALGNAFSPKYKEGRAGFRKDVNELLNNLGDEASILTLVTSARIKNNGEVDDLRKVYAILFLNKDTREFVQIFVVEGTM